MSSWKACEKKFCESSCLKSN